MPVTLRYFDCRGRAQPLRFFLAHHKVSFTDERVPFMDDWITWAGMKADRQLSGPFAKLPVLEWQGQCYTQTNLIASFLQNEIAPGDNHRIVNETQSCLSKHLGQLYILFNLDLFAPGADIEEFSDRTLASLDSAFAGYESLLTAGEKPFGSPDNWSIAAFWLLELWQFTRMAFAPRESTLIKTRPRPKNVLTDLAAEGDRLAVEAEAPAFWTARPDAPQRLPAVQKAIAMT